MTLNRSTHCNAPYFIILLCLMPDNFTLLERREPDWKVWKLGAGDLDKII